MDTPKNELTVHGAQLAQLERRIEHEKAEATRLQHAGAHDLAREALAHAEQLIEQRDKLKRKGPTTDF